MLRTVTAAIALVTLATGCSMGAGGSGVEVTRMHLGAPIERGSFELQSPAAVGGITPAYQAQATAVTGELRRLGFTNAGDQSTYVVAVDPTSGLDVKLRRRDDGTIVWEGRAVPATPSAAMPEKLARALFRDFPGRSGATIKVR